MFYLQKFSTSEEPIEKPKRTWGDNIKTGLQEVG